MKDGLLKDILKFLTNRLLVLFVIFAGMFYFLVMRLFDLQVVQGESFLKDLSATTVRPLSISAPRGTIYDTFGRPLAINKSSFVVKFDPSVLVADLNTVISDLVNLFEANGESYVDTFPISIDEPFEFIFDGSETREERWKKDMEVPSAMSGAKYLNAEETFQYLRTKFKIPEDMPNIEARKILAMRSMIYMQRYRSYYPITLAYEVSDKTVALIEEESDKYAGVYIDVESLREYPEGKYFSHTLGYIGSISDKEMDQYKSQGYTAQDIVGKTGIERSFESVLNGIDGEMKVEVNNVGRRVSVVEETPPVQGGKVFLTLDTYKQQKTYDILENMLTTILKNKLQRKSAKEAPITVKQFLMSLVKTDTISTKKIMNSEEDSYSYTARTYIQSELDKLSEQAPDESEEAKPADPMSILSAGIDSGAVSPATMILVLEEQGVITLTDDERPKVKVGTKSALQVILEKLDTKELRPDMTTLDPSSGSVAVVDVKTGAVLAAVSYPSYDNNQLVNNINNAYYTKLLNSNGPAPLNNRVFTEPRAPGSIFKMITAIAGLETGVISTTSTIYDGYSFEKAGWPYTRCWSASSHGNLNVSQALEVSCNYFFCEVAYRIGNTKNGNKLDSINALNQYMIAFGMNDRTGVEIGELYDQLPEGLTMRISSPEYKIYAKPTDNDWYDGDTVQTSIGQGFNNLTTATMAKYTATLASGGTRNKLYLMDRIESQQGDLLKKTETVVEAIVDLKQETWDSVYKGMLAVINGSLGTGRGTGRSVFANFPVKVAGKTGTAQENLQRNDHSSFVGFAPYDDPQIAICVEIPFGDTLTTPASASQVARDVLAEFLGLYVQPELPEKVNSLVK